MADELEVKSSEQELKQLPRSDRGVPHDRLALYIMSKCTFKTLADTEEVLVYHDEFGVYLPNGETVIKGMVEKILTEIHLGQFATNKYVDEVRGHIQRSTYKARGIFNSDKEHINVLNGILDLKTRELKPHTPEFLSTIQIPVKYNPEADCPKIRQFFREIVRPGNVRLLREICAWCLDVESFIQRFIIFIGEGTNGKSTYLNLLRAFLGVDNCSAVILQSFITNRFSTANLYGKLANIYPDLPTTRLHDAGMLKALTGGDAITGERKFQPAFTFVNKAKLIFSANQPPVIDDDSLGMWRRLVTIDFPNKFEGKNKKPDIIKELTTPEELSGLLNIALDALETIRKHGDFSYSPTWEQTRDKYLVVSDPVTAFIEEKCLIDAGAEVSKQELFEAYVAFCSKEKIPAGNKKAFGRTLKKKFRVTIGERATYWTGLELLEGHEKVVKMTNGLPTLDWSDEE